MSPGDLGAVVALHGTVYAAEHGLDHRMEASVAEGMAQLAGALARSDGAALWVAEDGGDVVGAIVMTDEGEGVARLRWFIVAPAARRSGVGGRLLDRALGWARAGGFERVVLFTFGDLVAAARMYRHAGFRLVAERQGMPWSDELVEQRWELQL